ncbi:MAG: hypothetical protein SPI90_11295 [Fusobacterium mortiferum]|nr:hypothetical protein [Fusobacterium mortiferum]MDY5981892.1 hypothetical protein [Fusobacterium mortiferum]
MNREIKILMHTHWDREWYFTKDETQVLLRNHMFQVIEFLEENEDIIYILDGQSVMLDGFIEFAPKWKTRVENLVKRGALRVGPWYTQNRLASSTWGINYKKPLLWNEKSFRIWRCYESWIHSRYFWTLFSNATNL